MLKLLDGGCKWLNECVALAEGLHNGISGLKLECLKVIMLKSWELFYGLLLLLEALISLAKWLPQKL